MSSEQALIEEQNALLKQQNELMTQLIKQGQANCRFQKIMADSMVVIASAVIDTDTEDTIMGCVQDGFTSLGESIIEAIADREYHDIYDETVGDNFSHQDDDGAHYNPQREL